LPHPNRGCPEEHSYEHGGEEIDEKRGLNRWHEASVAEGAERIEDKPDGRPVGNRIGSNRAAKHEKKQRLDKSHRYAATG
jgi:hypothetical protein